MCVRNTESACNKKGKTKKEKGERECNELRELYSQEDFNATIIYTQRKKGNMNNYKLRIISLA